MGGTRHARLRQRPGHVLVATRTVPARRAAGRRQQRLVRGGRPASARGPRRAGGPTPGNVAACENRSDGEARPCNAVGPSSGGACRPRRRPHRTRSRCVPRDTVEKEIARTLSQHQVTAVPVVDRGGRALGVVSEGWTSAADCPSGA
ncbi:CBS domain-containing protein [Streptomyces sp. B6(2022)]|uniref:CBS domain-containing protein n=1 Tax=Streptomyces sp. B6(2022) TaxID=3404749 RepID=UPI003AF04F6F